MSRPAPSEPRDVDPLTIGGRTGGKMARAIALAKERLRARLLETVRISDEHERQWPQWLKDAAALSPVFTTGRTQERTP